MTGRRPLGAATRGTTNPNRLRRMDNWLVARLGDQLSSAADPLVIDLGFGATPVTAIELRSRLSVVRPDVRVVGLEIDRNRVASARPYAQPPGLDFAVGGFELAGLRPLIVRAANVLRQYREADVEPAWAAMRAALAPGGAIVEGTCDEVGRLGSWVLLDAAGPLSLTLATRLASLQRPATLAERLPKALIHRNVAGQGIHTFLAALDAAWVASVSLRTFGPRQRWIAACQHLRDAGFPVVDRADRWRRGELTVAWPAVAPTR